MTLYELNQLAAEELLGWSVIDGRIVKPIGYDGKTGEVAAWEFGNHWPNPVQDIAQAWACLGRIEAVDKQLRQEGTKGLWVCRITPVDGIRGWAEASTASEAIVRACLKTKGVEV